MTMPQVTDEVKKLLSQMVPRVRVTIIGGPSDTPATVLEWLKGQDPKTVREAIRQTQPQAWAVASEPLVDSLSDDQCVGMLAAFMAVYVQTL